MKRYLFALLLIASQTVSAQQSTTPAATQIESAVKQARQENKTVFIRFSASWCSWCKRLDKMLASPELSDIFNQHFVLLKLIVEEGDPNLETPGAAEFKSEHAGDGSGLPYYVFLDGKGNMKGNSNVVEGENLGYPGKAFEVPDFLQLIKDMAPDITQKELDAIESWLNETNG